MDSAKPVLEKCKVDDQTANPGRKTLAAGIKQLTDWKVQTVAAAAAGQQGEETIGNRWSAAGSQASQSSAGRDDGQWPAAVQRTGLQHDNPPPTSTTDYTQSVVWLSSSL